MEGNKKNNYFFKGKFQKNELEDESNDFFDLCAIDDAEQKKCSELLEWGIKRKKIKNIAVTGPFGAGKTSFLKSFANTHSQYNYLNISLATFNNDASEEMEKVVEESILQQILYKKAAKRFPQSRIQRIKSISVKKYLAYSILVYFWVCLLEVIMNPQNLNFLDKILIQIPLPFFEKYYLILNQLGFGMISLFLLYKIISFFNTIKVNLKIGETKVELSNNKEASIFYTHLDEIIYFFKRTKFNVVFFEDIDRFENINLKLFTKLRELNGMLNDSEDIKRPINFIFAVKDDLFEPLQPEIQVESDEKKKKNEKKNHKLRIKFFDLIVPIIPVIDNSNSYEEMSKKLKKIGEFRKIEEDKIHEEFEQDLRFYSYFIDEMRLVNNIYNELLVYKENLKVGENSNDNLSNERKLDIKRKEYRNLLGIIVYKNLNPRDFSDSHFMRGLIYKAFKSKNGFIEKQAKTLQNDIDKFNKKIDNTKEEDLNSLKELRMIMLFQIFNRNDINENYNLEGLTIEELIKNEENFEKIEKSADLQWRFNNSTSPTNKNLKTIEKDLKTNYDVEIEYEKRKLRLKDKENINELSKKIEELKLRINELEKMSLNELIEMYNVKLILPEEILKNVLLVYLLENEIIEEKSYRTYISYFYNESLTKTDRDFLMNVRVKNKFAPTYKLINKREVINQLYPKDFRGEYIFNYDLIEYIMLNHDEFPKKAAEFFTYLNKNLTNVLEFIDELLSYTKSHDLIYNTLISIFTSEIKYFWDTVFNSKFSNEKKEKYLVDILNISQIDDIVFQNGSKMITEYFNLNNNVLSIVNRMNQFNENKAKTIIQRLNLHCIKLNAIKKDETFNYIYENNLYDISKENIENICKVLIKKPEDALKNLEVKNYSTIKEYSELKSLLKYINDEMKEYLENVFLKIETNTNEKEESILEIFNNSLITGNVGLQGKILEMQEVIFSDINQLPKMLWEEVLETKKIKPIWKNILSYYDYKKMMLDEILIKVLDQFDFVEKLTSSLLFDFVELEKDVLEQFSIKIIKLDKLNEKSYSALIRSFNKIYDYLNLEGISDEKISILIENKLVSLNNEMIQEFKEKCSHKLNEFIISRIEEYFDNFDILNENLDDENLKDLFTYEQMGNDNRFKFINRINLYDLNENSSLAEAIKQFLVQIEEYKLFEEETLRSLNKNSFLPLKKQLISVLNDLETDAELSDYFTRFLNEILDNINSFELKENQLIIILNIISGNDLEKFINKIDFDKITLSANFYEKLIELIEIKEINLEFDKFRKILKMCKKDDVKLRLLLTQINNLNDGELHSSFKIFKSPYREFSEKDYTELINSDENSNLLKTLTSRNIVPNYTENENGKFGIEINETFYSLQYNLKK